MNSQTISSVAERVHSLDWQSLASSLDDHGCAVAEILTESECDELAAMYDAGEHFRKRVGMARHGFGRGEYKYFQYPLPELVSDLRTSLYPPLAQIANRWNETLGGTPRFPVNHAEYLRRCHAAGQTEPTPLVLRYGSGDYNCLHQDLYGDLVFP